MSQQITLTLTLSEEEEKAITRAYALYVSGGGRSSKNKFVKQLILDKVRI